MLRCKSRLLVGLIFAFVLSPSGSATAATDLVITGHGWGHGVGMSQWGAQGYALHGSSYRQIINHYYPGTTLGSHPNQTVRVLLRSGMKRFVLTASAPVRIGGKVHPAGNYKLNTSSADAKPLRITSTQPLGAFGHHWRGALTVIAHGTKADVINEVSLEQYLRGVVPSEMPSSFAAEALKAQAVVARSYALATLKTSGEFDLYPDDRSQMYGGVDAETSPTNAAVAATAGKVVLWQGQVASTFFYASSGGRSEAIQDAWPGAAPVPYLRSVADPFDTIAPEHDWGPVIVPAGKLHRVLPAWPASWTTFSLKRNASERVNDLDVAGGLIGAGTFAQALGLDSTWFSVGELGLELAGGSVKVQTYAVGQSTLEELSEGAWQQLRRLPANAELSLHLEPGRYRLRSGAAIGQPLAVPAVS